MAQVHFDRYYRYDDLTRILYEFAQEYPKLTTLESIGKSHEGRNIWVLTITNHETGAHNEKPALWADGNIHASEVSATSACLYLINKLLTGYGTNDDITRAVDTRTFYICPRFGPDGAELALAEKPRIIRSSTRPYPYDEEPFGGLISEDLDGDGRILQMRLPDPNGHWKPHPQEPRLLVRRDPTEVGGTYYRVLSEGTIENYDGVSLYSRKNKEGLDLNRNFPGHWRTENEQVGAGPFPTSEPEVRAVVAFLTSHRNITGAVTFHTYSGVILRPFGTQADDSMPAEDLWTFQKIGEKGTAITGYPTISVYHEFRYHPKETITGVFDDWLYDHFGIYAWTVEIWSLQRQAGIDKYKYIEWYREHSADDDLKLLQWADANLDGKGYVDWYKFNHPQLGEVELGGWDNLLTWRNPPPSMLEKEIAPFADWLVWMALISPKLELYETKVTALGDGAYHIRVVANNAGWLPSYVSKQAMNRKAVRGTVFEIALPEGATLRTGQKREELGQLEGRAYTYSTNTPWGVGATANSLDRLKCEWVVSAPKGSTVQIAVKNDRAGVVRKELVLE
jgi:murein tripeptide amidase MpaA